MSKEKPDRFQAEGKRQEIELETVVISKDDIVLKPSVKGFSFEHSCLTEGHGLNKPNADAIIYACSLLRQGMKQICITAISSDAREHFLLLAVRCASVICCRVSPEQKKLAVMASDFSAAQFCFLERLLVVHGDIGVIRGSHRCKSHFTWIQHLFIWGSIAMWYLFLFVYDKLSPPMSGNAYRLLVEALAPAPIFGQTPSW
ncbi:hypothetical protein V6N13_015805 [Hibiscus sabdariffa]